MDHGVLYASIYQLWVSYVFENSLLTIFPSKSFDATPDSNPSVSPFLEHLEYQSNLNYVIGESLSNTYTIFFTGRSIFEFPLYDTKEKFMFINKSPGYTVEFHIDLGNFLHLNVRNDITGNFNSFTSMFFYCQELDAFFDPLQTKIMSIGGTSNKNITLNEHCSKEISFKLKGANVVALFRKSYIFDGRKKVPLEFYTQLEFRFDRTNDINLIISLYQVANNFLTLIFNRKNIVYDTIFLLNKLDFILSPPNQETTSFLIVDSDSYKVPSSIKNINPLRPTYELFEDHIQELFQFMADGNFYDYYFPDSPKEKTIYSEGRLLLTLCGFEWNASKCYKASITSDREQVVADILRCIDAAELGNENDQGEVKYNKYYRKELKSIKETLNYSAKPLNRLIKEVLMKYIEV